MSITPDDPVEQRYETDTFVCRTVVRGRESIVEVRDGLLWDGPGTAVPGRLVRVVTVLRGPADVVVSVVPGRDLRPARDVWPFAEGLAFDDVVVRTGAPFVDGRCAQRLDQGARLAISIDPAGARSAVPMSPDAAMGALDRTAAAWRRVLADCAATDPVVRRSLLAIRAAQTPEGGVQRAMTTSLPSVIGGERNVDDRVTSITSTAGWSAVAESMGLAAEAAAAAEWLTTVLADAEGLLPRVLHWSGGRPPGRREVSWLDGFERSQPVRLGSDDADPVDLEATAAVVALAADGASEAGAVLRGRWHDIVRAADALDAGWAEADAGTWLLPRPTTSLGTRVLVRAALAAIAATGAARNPLDLDAAGWREGTRLLTDWLEQSQRDRGADRSPDASLLRAAWLGPWPAHSPVTAAIVDRTLARLSSGPLVFAYPPDLDDGYPPLAPPSTVATLWAARALAAVGDWDGAHARYEAAVRSGGGLGLLGPHIDPVHGIARGNLPFTPAHLALVETARALALGPA